MLQKSDLMGLGLTNNEAEVYIILLKLKEAKAYDIAKYTPISRSHVYDSLNILLGKGLVNYIIKGKAKLFRITDPNNLISILEVKEESILKQKEDLKKKIEDLKEKETIAKSKVEVYEGIEGIKYILNDVIKDGIEKKYREALVSNSLSVGEFTKFVPEYILQRYLNLRKKHKIWSKHLYAKGEKTIKHPFFKAKILPKEYFSDKVSHFIYGNKIVYFILTLRPLVIRIESEEVAELYKKQFELLWKLAKK